MRDARRNDSADEGSSDPCIPTLHLLRNGRPYGRAAQLAADPRFLQPLVVAHPPLDVFRRVRVVQARQPPT